ncbi:S1-like domain-containing RNA-binding protein, partial [Nosocomiicoccus massiliensis]|uniref:S1-like domain-containing RNA-binding protein n=1 Tax=Nosocomiicoccus massiliensis TaxID=1232430 RepID=UPI0005941FED
MKRLSGTTQFLTLDRVEGSTLYFKTEDDEVIRMNKSLQQEEYEVGQDVAVFIYPNTRGELFASPVIPKITRDKFDFVPVSDVTYDGVYIDIDAPKDFLIPYEDLPKLKKVWPKPGDEVMATLRVESDNQIYGRLITETEAREMSQPFD